MSSGKVFNPPVPVGPGIIQDRLFHALEEAEGVRAVVHLVIEALERGEHTNRAAPALRLVLCQTREIVDGLSDLESYFRQLEGSEQAAADAREAMNACPRPMLVADLGEAPIA